jgi:hypothetical protein
MLECPRRSWTILGWTFEASISLVWLCPSPCSVMLHSFKNALTTCVRLWGWSPEPSDDEPVVTRAEIFARLGAHQADKNADAGMA